MNPFVVLGIPAALDLDARELERRYLQLARESHPDHAAAGSDGELVAVLSRSAALNDAYKIVRERWARARALVDALDPGALEAEKKLAPAFLMEAMELAEEVAHARGDVAQRLRERIEADLERAFGNVRTALARSATREAARLLHEARYLQKALADLEEHA